MPEKKEMLDAQEKLTPEQAAQFLGIGVRTLQNKTREGLIKKHEAPVGVGRGGRRMYYLRSDLEALKRQMVFPADKPKGKR